MTFLLIALLAGIGVALMAAPLGSFIVWQRLAYFGDTLAHASLLGIAFSLLLSINMQLTIIICGIFVATLLTSWQKENALSNDTLLGILSHSTLALGLVLISVFGPGRVDLSSYLLGDLLSSTTTDLIIIYSLLIFVSTALWYFWKPLICMTANPDLASVEGVNIKKMRLVLLVLLAITIAMAIKIVGVLLITALLIIPAATARFFSTSAERMVAIAAGIGCISVIAGLSSSLFWDTPAGPSIVVSASLLFLFATLLKRHSSDA